MPLPKHLAVHKRGCENPVTITGHHRAPLMVVYTHDDPGDQYDIADHVAGCWAACHGVPVAHVKPGALQEALASVSQCTSEIDALKAQMREFARSLQNAECMTMDERRALASRLMAAAT